MKQCGGATYGHFANIFLSYLLVNKNENCDECQWYCLNFIIDTTFGTLFNISFLTSFVYITLIFCSKDMKEYIKIGDYGYPPSLYIWILQFVLWLIIISCGKLIILPILIYLSSSISQGLEFIFDGLKNDPNLELVVVMIIIPFFLNSLQFWLQDSYLKQQPFSAIHESEIEGCLALEVRLVGGGSALF